MYDDIVVVRGLMKIDAYVGQASNALCRGSLTVLNAP